MTELLLLIGGIGLFLFGMQGMTEALRELAGGSARQVLSRFTRTPLAGAATGAAITSLIQSSSATLVMTIGMVGAGILSFPSALGIIIGANIGTTMTGWMVMFLGFKLQLGLIALPLLFVGAMLRLLGRGQVARIGTALAGFALIFVGIGMMQDGTAGFEGRLTPASFPDDTLGGRLLLVLIGMSITIVMQSSSAGVATALLLLSVGSVTFAQASAMVIGMHIGTTFTAVMASIGGSRAMRQTAVADVIYMTCIGALAFTMLPLAAPLMRDMVAGGDAQIGLVAFHTSFNIIGAGVVLPLAHRFAALVQWLVPERPAPLIKALDKALLSDTNAALDALSAATSGIAQVQFSTLGNVLNPGRSTGPLDTACRESAAALDAVRSYQARITMDGGRPQQVARHAAILHVVDHLARLTYRLSQTNRLASARADPDLRRVVGYLSALLSRPLPDAALHRRLEWLNRHLAWREHRLRRQIMRAGMEPARMFTLTDSMRWLRRVTAHAERIMSHAQAALPNADDPIRAPAAGEATVQDR